MNVQFELSDDDDGGGDPIRATSNATELPEVLMADGNPLPPDDTDHKSGFAINDTALGILIGTVATVAILIVLLLVMYTRRRTRRKATEPIGMMSPSISQVVRSPKMNYIDFPVDDPNIPSWDDFGVPTKGGERDPNGGQPKKSIPGNDVGKLDISTFVFSNGFASDVDVEESLDAGNIPVSPDNENLDTSSDADHESISELNRQSPVSSAAGSLPGYDQDFEQVFNSEGVLVGTRRVAALTALTGDKRQLIEHNRIYKRNTDDGSALRSGRGSNVTKRQSTGVFGFDTIAPGTWELRNLKSEWLLRNLPPFRNPAVPYASVGMHLRETSFRYTRPHTHTCQGTQMFWDILLKRVRTNAIIRNR